MRGTHAVADRARRSCRPPEAQVTRGVTPASTRGDVPPEDLRRSPSFHERVRLDRVDEHALASSIPELVELFGARRTSSALPMRSKQLRRVGVSGRAPPFGVGGESTIHLRTPRPAQPTPDRSDRDRMCVTMTPCASPIECRPPRALAQSRRRRRRLAHVEQRPRLRFRTRTRRRSAAGSAAAPARSTTRRATLPPAAAAGCSGARTASGSACVRR